MPLPPGTKLGPYEISASLGAGAMGEVYRAKDTRLGREVAIKVLPGALAQNTDRLQRFEQEARVLGTLGARHLTGRLKRLTLSVAAVEHDETARIEIPPGVDEVARLGSAFAKILAKDVPGVSVEVRQALANLTEHNRHLRDALGEVGRIIATLDS